MSRHFPKWENSATMDLKNESAAADTGQFVRSSKVQSGKLKGRAPWPALVLLLAACSISPESPPSSAQVNSAVSWPIKAPPHVHAGPAQNPKPAARANPASTGKAPSEETAPPPLPPCPDEATSLQKQILQKLDCLIRIEETKPNGSINAN